MRAEATPGASALLAPTLLALELVVLYGAGSYATARLAGPAASRGGLARIPFYLLVFPGVVLHETAHYLACVLTGTRVVGFAPFSPRRLADGRLMLGYVRHERRAFPVRALIGVSPLLVNPAGLLLVTALLTPVSLDEVAALQAGGFAQDLFWSGFPLDHPLRAAVWAYLSLSFALGSVPSREDLAGVPAVLVLLCAAALVALLPNDAGFLAALDRLASLAVGLYALPAVVAIVAAFVARLLR